MSGLRVWKLVPEAHALSESWPFHILICDSLGFWAPPKQPVGPYAGEAKLNLSLMLKYQRETNLSLLEMILGCKRKPGCVP